MRHIHLSDYRDLTIPIFYLLLVLSLDEEVIRTLLFLHPVLPVELVSDFLDASQQILTIAVLASELSALILAGTFWFMPIISILKKEYILWKRWNKMLYIQNFISHACYSKNISLVFNVFGKVVFSYDDFGKFSYRSYQFTFPLEWKRELAS